MKYELIKMDLGIETATENGKYSIDITLGLHPLDGFTPDFSKTISVESNNDQTGVQVDVQREKAINDFINQINS